MKGIIGAICGDIIGSSREFRPIKTRFGLKYPDAGYGGMFMEWLSQDSPEAYGSWANGSAMRVSPVAWAADSLEEAQKLAKISAIVTHNHPEGIKGALATSDAIFLARTGSNKEEIKQHIENNYNYDLSRKLDDIAAIGGSIASAYWDVPSKIAAKSIMHLDSNLLEVFIEFRESGFKLKFLFVHVMFMMILYSQALL